ncbi:ADP-ribosylglycohydrolase family protein [Micrococcaceae bacterium Sec5.7]
MNDNAINESPSIIAGAGYAEQVYAGLLGKVIGVYLGRPVENWTYESIQERLGDIEYYVHDKLGVPLIVTDDDIAGTVTFLRAAEDSGRGYDTSAMDVAACWLNYLIENRSVLWWGGVGNSTEHTAYMRLKDGYQPPYSGSIELNSKTVAEQIGSQIFIDGWAMIAPGSPKLAAELARRASTVSHDGEAIYGAQMLAAMESMAFATADINTIIEAGLAQIPTDSVIAMMIADIRRWHDTEPNWRKARENLQASYGYELYGGNCHMVPNHGLIILAFLYGNGDFSRSMMIVNTAGWDTDCNSGNLGCLIGIMHGLAGLEAGHDWRGPVADRIYVPTADAGSGITDVVLESLRITNIARAAVGLEPLAPKNGARFHFSFPGSMQGFTVPGAGSVCNAELPDSSGERGLLITGSEPISVATPTFIPPEARTMPGGYALDVSPTIYSGQEMTMEFLVASDDFDTITDVTAFVRHYNGEDELVEVQGPAQAVTEGRNSLSWIIPDTSGQPIADIGIMVRPRPGKIARLFLDRVDWSGIPTISLRRPADGGTMWRRAWVDNLDHQEWQWPESFRLIANTRERRVMITGSLDWQDYAVEAALTPHMADSMGIAARVQGLQRYYLLRCDRGGELQLIKRDGEDRVLARAPFHWRPEEQVRLRLEVNGGSLHGFVDGTLMLSASDDLRPLRTGGVAVACEAGRVGCDEVNVEPLVPSVEAEVARMDLQIEADASL